jgi:SEC-C motif-containing protein
MALTVRDCPCGSGLRYRACCGPLHEAARRAESPEALMRSRYAAFALGRGEYLFDTLAADHPDRSAPREAAARELSRVRERQRFMGLTILHASADGDDGEVLFFARIFEKGAEHSFAELSRFVREDGAWRYASGELLPRSLLPAEVTTLDREGFLALAQAAQRSGAD